MKQEVKNFDEKDFDISVEEFDALDGKHTFSREYQRRKRKMWKEYRKTVYAGRRNYARIAVAAALSLAIMVPAAVNAASDGDLFNRIWGSSGKKAIEAHDVTVVDEEKGTSFTYTAPKREYVDISPDKAEELIGENISKKVIERQLGDTKLTILSVVSDGQSAVMEFKLERKGGVNALKYDPETDVEAVFSDDATFFFAFTDFADCIHVDWERSKDDCLYCYDYMTSTSDSKTQPKELQLEITEYPCARKELYGKTFDEDFPVSTLSIPLEDNVDTVDYVNADGGVVSISPISIKIDMAVGLGLDKTANEDPGNVYYVAVTDTKGETYIVVKDDTKEHPCDEPIDNSVYAVGHSTHLTYAFNRLVDTSDIAYITINDTKYKCK